MTMIFIAIHSHGCWWLISWLMISIDIHNGCQPQLLRLTCLSQLSSSAAACRPRGGEGALQPSTATDELFGVLSATGAPSRRTALKPEVFSRVFGWLIVFCPGFLVASSSFFMVYPGVWLLVMPCCWSCLMLCCYRRRCWSPLAGDDADENIWINLRSHSNWFANNNGLWWFWWPASAADPPCQLHAVYMLFKVPLVILSMLLSIISY